MAIRLSIGIVALILGMTGCSSARGRFAGAWRLASLEQTGADGNVRRIECCGSFLFTRDGHLSVQVMDHAQSQDGPAQYSQGGYEATYGAFTVDESKHTFTVHVEGSLVRSLIGKDLPRLYEFAGNRLIVKPVSDAEHWRVVWERY